MGCLARKLRTPAGRSINGGVAQLVAQMRALLSANQSAAERVMEAGRYQPAEAKTTAGRDVRPLSELDEPACPQSGDHPAQSHQRNS